MMLTDRKSYREKIEEDIAEYIFDPYGFVCYSYPWGEPGTPLFQHSGPDVWQKEFLQDLGKRYYNACVSDVSEAVRMATASGHGAGKSGLVAWIIDWFISTHVNPQIVTTANTRTQLLTKTWRELAKWHKLSINQDWFTWRATKFYKNSDPETWAAHAIPWSEQNSEAFAGTHADHVLIIFDEASAIADVIWEVTEGALTTKGAIWIAFGNPTRNSGRFRECFRKHKHRWVTRNIDTRTCKMANRRQLEQWIEDYGIDSDFAKVRILGQFPSASSMQLIPTDLVEKATHNLVVDIPDDVKILGCDVARFGDDHSTICLRTTNRAFKPRPYYGLRTTEFGDIIARAIDDEEPDAVFVDGNGIGAGVVDYLIKLNYEVIDVQFGGKAEDDAKYLNKRAEMYGRIKDWLGGDVWIEPNQELEDDLIAVEYGYNIRNQIVLEKKEDTKERLGRSPDWADALALTFAEPVFPKRNQRHVGNQALQKLREQYDWRSL